MMAAEWRYIVRTHNGKKVLFEFQTLKQQRNREDWLMSSADRRAANFTNNVNTVCVWRNTDCVIQCVGCSFDAQL